jgi:hypothetical protein
MAITSSGAITFANLQSEFGGSHPITISEYYRNAGAVPGNNTNVPTSGVISLSNFYGAVNELAATSSGSASTYNVSAAFSSSWTSAIPKRLTINSGVAFGHVTVPSNMGGTLTIDHSGSMQGLGGSANSGAGSTAMTIQVAGVTINMLSGSTISGGGGGGGLGGNGGNGLWSSGCGECKNSLPSGCTACCTSCCNGGEEMIVQCSYNTSGGGGGAGGRGQGYGQSLASGTSGGGPSGPGNGYQAGSGGTGGAGSTFGNAGNNGSNGANGNNGSGGTGATGGAAGRAVTFSGVSAYTIMGTTSGTIHGAYT